MSFFSFFSVELDELDDDFGYATLPNSDSKDSGRFKRKEIEQKSKSQIFVKQKKPNSCFFRNF